MNKTQNVTMQATISLFTVVAVFYIFFGSTAWLSYYNFDLYLWDELTFINILFGLVFIWIIGATLFCIAFLKRKIETPRLDKIIKILLYIMAINMLVAWIYHTECSFLPFGGAEQSLLQRSYNTDAYFWFKIVLASLCYLIPASLYLFAARINKK